MKTVQLELSEAELDLLAIILGFVGAGDISGGPLDAETAIARTTNVKTFGRLETKVSLAMPKRRRTVHA